MATRPSARWRARVDEEATEIAAGTRAPRDAFLSELFPESLLAATDKALHAFESEMDPLHDQDDGQDFEVIRRVVLALNEINEDHNGAGYETEERGAVPLHRSDLDGTRHRCPCSGSEARHQPHRDHR
ncbi:hypothetical protein [Streptomyces sp. Tu 3180]|uniref:hypothetical protein n=1 Tax=Streptomyces sp. Tu 3180 TaxID=2682611 RepID=UPI001FB57E5C|nr:hypothetical protein [Streptomyces sp. Tu 3180]